MRRRTFLKATTVGGAVALGFDVSKAEAEMRAFKIARTTETRSICPYCAVSCGVIIHTLGDKAKNVQASVVHVEGDADHPISRGSLCPKGATLKDDITHKNRLRHPKVRRPGSDRWEDISWEQAFDEIARKVKTTRDATFVERDEQGFTVNRCEGIGWTGGCTDTNELNYLAVKAMRDLGLATLAEWARRGSCPKGTAAAVTAALIEWTRSVAKTTGAAPSTRKTLLT